jgi:hypothetical protein
VSFASSTASSSLSNVVAGATGPKISSTGLRDHENATARSYGAWCTAFASNSACCLTHACVDS